MPSRMRSRFGLTTGFALGVLAFAPAGAARAPERLAETPSAVQTVTAEQLQHSDLSLDVTALLNGVRTNPAAAGDAFSRARVSVRGLSAADRAETLAFLDGLPPRGALTYSAALSDIATIHARDIGGLGLVSHTGSDGSSMGDRFVRRGISTMLKAEELSFGETRPESVLFQLLADPGVAGRPHRMDLVNPVFTQVGVGCAKHSRHGQVCVIELSGPFMDGPRSIVVPVAPPSGQPSCPAGQATIDLDRYRTDLLRSPLIFDFGGAMRGPTLGGLPHDAWRTDFARANEVAWQVQTRPGGAFAFPGPGICPPRTPASAPTQTPPPASSPPAAPPPAPQPPPGKQRYCWYNDTRSDWERPSFDRPPNTYPEDDTGRMINHHTGETFEMNPAGQWVSLTTGELFVPLPEGASLDDNDHKRAADSRTGERYSLRPCPPPRY